MKIARGCGIYYTSTVCARVREFVSKQSIGRKQTINFTWTTKTWLAFLEIAVTNHTLFFSQKVPHGKRFSVLRLKQQMCSLMLDEAKQFFLFYCERIKNNLNQSATINVLFFEVMIAKLINTLPGEYSHEKAQRGLFLEASGNYRAR